jgi:hypothetical protein
LMPNGWCITTMTYRCSWLTLMVALAGEADRCWMKMVPSSISAFCWVATKTKISFISAPWLRWRRGCLSPWCKFVFRYEPNVTSEKHRCWY